MLHLNGHAKTRLGIIDFSVSFRITKKDKHRVPNKLVDGATVSECNFGHLCEISIEQLGNLFWLETFCNPRKILNVGEKNRKSFSLSVNCHVLLSVENALVDLGRQVSRDLRGQRIQKIVLCLKFGVHSANRRRLPALHRNENSADSRSECKIG